jgi:hypothetical protein
MSMYLPNSALGPTGSEPAEYLDVPASDRPTDVPPAPTGRTGGPTALDPQTRLNIIRWTHEYLAGLVANHHGSPEDVRSIIHELHDGEPIAALVQRRAESTVNDRRGSA